MMCEDCSRRGDGCAFMSNVRKRGGNVRLAEVIVERNAIIGVENVCQGFAHA